MGMKKINRVSWASGPNLFQVKHFLQEDCPSKVGRGSPHHLQLKPCHLNVTRQCLKQSKERTSYMPQVKWKCPPKFKLNDNWCVVAGEESKEAEVQMHRDRKVLEAVYPSQSSIPPNPSSLLDLDQFYDDNLTREIPIIPIEELAAIEVSSDLTQCNQLLDPCLPNSSLSSISTESSQTLAANGKSQSSSTSQNLTIPQSNSPFSARQLVNEQPAPPYPSRLKNLNGSDQSQVSSKLPANHNPVPQHSWTCANLSISQPQTEFSLKLPANQNHDPKHPSTGENRNIPQFKSKVSEMPPATRNPVRGYQSTCGNLNIPQHQAEVLSKSPANHSPATQCQSTYENLNLLQRKTPISPKPPTNGISAPQYQSTSTRETLSVQNKTQVSSNPPANEKSILEIPHGFKGDLVAAAATAMAALAKSQEPGSLIDTDLLIKLLSNPEQIQALMNEHGLGTNPKSGAAYESKPTVPSTPTPSSTAHSLAKQVAGNENRKCFVADSTVFSRSAEVRNANEQRETAAISRSVNPMVPLPKTKPDKVINKPINEHQAVSGPVFGPNPMAKSVPLATSKPDKSLKGNLVNEEQAPTHVRTAGNTGFKSLVPHNAELNLEKVKKLINEYGAPDSVGRKPLANSELVPSSRANLPELQMKSYSPHAVPHTSPFSSVTSSPVPPVHKDIDYYKSLIKQHGENRQYLDQQLLQSTGHNGNMQGPESVKNLKQNQPSLNFQKHCFFFNTSKGCLNGSSCPFLHDVTKQGRPRGMLEAPSSKRVKLGGELTG